MPKVAAARAALASGRPDSCSIGTMLAMNEVIMPEQTKIPTAMNQNRRSAKASRKVMPGSTAAWAVADGVVAAAAGASGPVAARGPSCRKSHDSGRATSSGSAASAA